MNNYIVLEGIEIYVFIFLVLTLASIGLIGLAVGIKHDARYEQIKDELGFAELRAIELNRENLRLKLKCGELKAGEKIDV